MSIMIGGVIGLKIGNSYYKNPMVKQTIKKLKCMIDHNHNHSESPRQKKSSNKIKKQKSGGAKVDQESPSQGPSLFQNLIDKQNAFSLNNDRRETEEEGGYQPPNQFQSRILSQLSNHF